MEKEQSQAIIEIKSAAKSLDRDPYLGIALIALALKRFRDADRASFDAFTAIAIGK